MDRRDRPLFDDLRQRPALRIVELGRNAWRLAVDQAVRSFAIETQYPIADAQGGKYVDMLKAGIIDPTKVVRTALQDAASIGGLLVTTEAMVAEKPEKKESAPAGMPDMGGMGM